MSGFGFSHHAVCCFPVTFGSRRLAAHRLESVSSWRYFTSAAGSDRERSEEQINGGRKQKGWWLPQRMTGSGLFSPFWGIALGIDGYRPGYRSEALNPSFLPVLEPSICFKKPRKTKDQGSGRNKARQQKRREGERDGWQRSRAVASEPQPRGTCTPAHDLHKKSFFLHVRCLKVFNGVSLFNFPYRFTQSEHPFQFLWRLTYWSLHRDFWPLHIWGIRMNTHPVPSNARMMLPPFDQTSKPVSFPQQQVTVSPNRKPGSDLPVPPWLSAKTELLNCRGCSFLEVNGRNRGGLWKNDSKKMRSERTGEKDLHAATLGLSNLTWWFRQVFLPHLLSEIIKG